MTKDAGTRIMKSLSKGWIWKTVGSPQQAWEATGGPPQQAQVFPRTSDRDWFCLSVYNMNSAPQTRFKLWLLKL